MINFLIVTGMIAASAAGNVLLKMGAVGVGFGSLDSLLNWKLFAGGSLFALAFLLYVLLLRRMPLNVAQCFMALQFVGVILGSYLILHEPLSPLRVAGVVVIALGVFFVAISNADPS